MRHANKCDIFPMCYYLHNVNLVPHPDSAAIKCIKAFKFKLKREADSCGIKCSCIPFLSLTQGYISYPLNCRAQYIQF